MTQELQISNNISQDAQGFYNGGHQFLSIILHNNDATAIIFLPKIQHLLL
jgi:hypothetical protein